MRNIIIEKLEGSSIEEQEIEIVERKGLGHPDYICDALSEAASQALSQYYLKNFDQVLHHNLDKGLLIAGKSEAKFGGGKILEPIKIIIAGRATDRVGKINIPVSKITEEAAKSCLRKILDLSPGEINSNNFKILIDYKPGAASLGEVFERSKRKRIALANDTSFGVGHGPLSNSEKLTLAVANLVNSSNFIKRSPFIGRDIKVMTLREKRNLILTIAIAFIDYYIKNPRDYFEKKEKIKKEIEKYLRKNFKTKFLEINLNTLDNFKTQDEAGLHLTCLGLSAEQGDDGQVGRGNRVCGLIVPCREMSIEAAAGKNINHPGKLYQILAHIIAQKIGKIEGIKECSVKLLSQIGKPLDQPQVVLVKVNSLNFSFPRKRIVTIINKIFDKLPAIQLAIVRGKYSLF